MWKWFCGEWMVIGYVEVVLNADVMLISISSGRKVSRGEGVRASDCTSCFNFVTTWLNDHLRLDCVRISHVPLVWKGLVSQPKPNIWSSTSYGLCVFSSGGNLMYSANNRIV